MKLINNFTHWAFLIHRQVLVKNWLIFKNISEEKAAKRSKCHLCSKSFTRASEVYVHANKNHLEIISQTWHECPECNRFFPTELALKNHQVSKSHGPYNGSEPKTKKKRIRSRVRKIEAPKSPPSEIAVTCVFCGQDFKTNAVFVAHVNQDHQEKVSGVWLPCDSCTFFYPDPRSLKVFKKYKYKFLAAKFEKHNFW